MHFDYFLYELKFKVGKLAFHRKQDFVQSMAGFNPMLNVSNLWVALNFFQTSELKAWFQLVMAVRVEVGLIRSVELFSLKKTQYDSPYDSVAYFQVWTKLTESHAVVKQINPTKILGTSILIGLSLPNCFWHQQFGFHWIVSNGDVSGV